MDSRTCARSLRGSVGIVGGSWLLDEATLAGSAERGLAEGLAGYMVGRLGVLGDTPVDNVVGAAYFWQPDFIRGLVVAGRAQTSPVDGAAVWAQLCQGWGRDHLTGMDGIDRLGELCEAVVTDASPLNAPLFVGWRDMPLPAVGPARSYQLMQTLRELRFARHCVAVQAAGMSPLEAILSGPAGQWNAKMFGWSEPYPDVAGLAEARDAIEDHTDVLHAPDLDVLSDHERAELRGLAKAARAYASS